MKRLLVTGFVVLLAASPTGVYAQHRGGAHGGGHGGFGGGGYGRGPHGGGFSGRGMGMGAPHAAGVHSGGFAYNHYGHFSNRPGYHGGGWYHGDWRGHWAGPWGYRPWGWGWYGGWGLGGPAWGYGIGYGMGYGLGYGVGFAGGGISVGIGVPASPWNWGYFGYYNPYWVAPVGGPTYINYSQPVVVVPPNPSVSAGQATANTAAPLPIAAASSQPTALQNEALAIFDNARSLFRKGNYREALAQTDRAVAIPPNDSNLHEFRGLCLFALKDYQQSAAAVHAVVSVGPGWNWTTVSNLYPSSNIYTEQLRALEKFCDQQPTASAPRFLLAYHYLLGQHNDQAAVVLKEVRQLEPDDQLAAQLLKGLTTPADAKMSPSVVRTPAQPVDAAGVVGHWKANRSDGSSFDLNLTKDHKFSWKFEQQDRKQELAGTYTLADDFMILSAGDQNTLVGKVSMQSSNQLTFRLAGANPAEPGLTFTR